MSLRSYLCLQTIAYHICMCIYFCKNLSNIGPCSHGSSLSSLFIYHKRKKKINTNYICAFILGMIKKMYLCVYVSISKLIYVSMCEIGWEKKEEIMCMYIYDLYITVSWRYKLHMKYNMLASPLQNYCN